MPNQEDGTQVAHPSCPGPYGNAAKLETNGVQVSAGKHLVRLVNIKDEIEVEIAVKAGQTFKFVYAFEDSGAERVQQRQDQELKDSKAKKPDDLKDKAVEKKEEVVDLPPEKGAADSKKDVKPDVKPEPKPEDKKESPKAEVKDAPAAKGEGAPAAN
jgi:hypothetical protein